LNLALRVNDCNGLSVAIDTGIVSNGCDGAMRSCEFDIELARPKMRSMRLNGVSTSFRLEEMYWRLLGRIACAQGVSISQLMSVWARHVDLHHGQVHNLSSYMRLSCLVYVLRHDIPTPPCRCHGCGCLRAPGERADAARAPVR